MGGVTLIMGAFLVWDRVRLDTGPSTILLMVVCSRVRDETASRARQSSGFSRVI